MVKRNLEARKEEREREGLREIKIEKKKERERQGEGKEGRKAGRASGPQPFNSDLSPVTVEPLPESHTVSDLFPHPLLN